MKNKKRIIIYLPFFIGIILIICGSIITINNRDIEKSTSREIIEEKPVEDSNETEIEISLDEKESEKQLQKLDDYYDKNKYPMEQDLIGKVGIYRLGISADNIEDYNTNNLIKLRIAFSNIKNEEYVKKSCSLFELRRKEDSVMSYCGKMSSEMSNVWGKDMNQFTQLERKNTTDTIDAERVEEVMHNLYGSDYEVKHESFGTHLLSPTSGSYMQYSEKNRIYGQFGCECGGTYYPKFDVVYSSIKEGNKLYIRTELLTLNGINEIEDKFPIQYLLYTFEKDQINGNYVFRNIKEEKEKTE